MKTFLEFKDYTTATDINPNYITPKMLQYRLQKIMDEYVAGVSTWYKTWVTTSYPPSPFATIVESKVSRSMTK